MSRYTPIKHRSSGRCFGCGHQLSVGQAGYWDNTTKRRLCSSCGERANTTPEAGPVRAMSTVSLQVIEELKRVVEAQAELSQKMETIEGETRACRLMLAALLERLEIDVPEGS